MKLLILTRYCLALLFLPFILIMCTTPEGRDTKSHSPVDYRNTDSLLIVKIDTLVEQINKGIIQQGLPDVLYLKILSENDSIEYWTVEDEPRRISLKMHPDNQFIWPTFFIKDGQLLLTRYREWRGDSIPMAREVFTYYNNGELFYAKERSMNLAPGQPPALLRQEEFHISDKIPEDLEAEYMQYYQIVIDTLSRYF